MRDAGRRLRGCTEGKRAYSVGTSSSSSSSLAKYKCDWLSAGAAAVVVGGDVSRPWGVTGSDSSLQKQWDMSSAGKERADVRGNARRGTPYKIRFFFLVLMFFCHLQTQSQNLLWIVIGFFCFFAAFEWIRNQHNICTL